MTSTCVIHPNSDVSGVGTRVGIYITSFLIAAIPHTKGHYGLRKLRKALLQAAGLNGFALVITAVVQTGECLNGCAELEVLCFYISLIVIPQVSSN
jgi:hypothetical protein